MKKFLKKLQEKRGAKQAAKLKAQLKALKQTALAELNENSSVKIDIKMPSKKGYIAKVERDDFNGDLSIRFYQVSGYLNDKIITFADKDILTLFIGFRFENKQHYLTIACYQKEHKIKVGDQLSFLFMNKNIIDFDIVEKGYRIDQDDEGVMIESKIPVSLVDIQAFGDQYVSKWRYTPGEQSAQHWTSTYTNERKDNMKEMAMAYVDVVEMFQDLLPQDGPEFV